jgi:hypothetical protein
MAIWKRRLFAGVGLLLAAAALLLGWGWWRGGGLQPIVVEEEVVAEAWMAGLEHAGPYPEMREPYMRAGEVLDSLGWDTSDGIGWYLDDPETTAPEACRGVYGRILGAEEAARWSHEDQVPGGLVVRALPGGKALTVRWPVKSDWAYIVGPMRVYPALTEALRSAGAVPSAVYEQYDASGKEVKYVMVIASEHGAAGETPQ